MQESEILYVDNHLLVVNKQAGIPTQPTTMGCVDNLTSHAKIWVKKAFNKSGEVFLEPIHRLDKPVSGIVVFAKTSKALSRLNESIRQKSCSKIYHGLIEGQMHSEQGTLEHYLIHEQFKATIATQKDKQAKFCRLNYTLLKKYSHTTLIEIFLETGRYHQIRAQLAANGHPIVGDIKYGSLGKSLLPETIFLHHREFSINHPVQKKPLTWQAPYPKHWDFLF